MVATQPSDCRVVTQFISCDRHRRRCTLFCGNKSAVYADPGRRR
ncbi:hypothetical protein [Lysobacter gummosus]